MAFRIDLYCHSTNFMGVNRNTWLSMPKLERADCILCWWVTLMQKWLLIMERMYSVMMTVIIQSPSWTGIKYNCKSALNLQQGQPRNRLCYSTGGSPVTFRSLREYFRSCALILSPVLHEALHRGSYCWHIKNYEKLFHLVIALPQQKTPPLWLNYSGSMTN